MGTVEAVPGTLRRRKLSAEKREGAQVGAVYRREAKTRGPARFR